MRFKEFLKENTDNFRIEEEGDWSTRVFLTAYLKDEKKNWLDKAIGDRPIVEITVDINSKTKTAHLNYVKSYDKGKGYAGEVVKYVFEKLKKVGITEVAAYTEHANLAPQSLNRKLGMEASKDDKHGKYWIKKL